MYLILKKKKTVMPAGFANNVMIHVPFLSFD